MTASVLINVLAFADADGTEGSINPVVPEIHDIFYAVIFFGALWALMKYVALPPVLKTMEERENHLRGQRAKADDARRDLASAQANYDQALADARAEGAAVVEAARAEGEAYRSEVMGAANAEVSQVKEQAAMAATASHDQAAGALNTQVSTIAIGAAEKVIGKRLDPAAQKPILDRVLGQAGAAGGASAAGAAPATPPTNTLNDTPDIDDGGQA